MAGKFRTYACLIFACASYFADAAVTRAAEPVQGRSRELGIAFNAAGNAKWCVPSVVIKLTAPSRAAFNLENPAFVLMIGRIKTIIIDQCPAADLITFEGETNRSLVFTMEMSRLTKWRRLTRLDPVSRKPICDGDQPSAAECDKRAAAYATIKQMMRGPTFADAEIIKLLDTGAVEHLVWRMNSVIGKLQLSHRGELGEQLADNALLADAIIAQTSEACRNGGERASSPTVANYANNLAYRGVTCQSAGRTAQNVVIVTSENNWYYIFGLWTDDPDKSKVTEVAGQLLDSIAALTRR
jgi:hypothetical protein